ncbi:bifunctional glycosyltransferase/CDP-glycerol:glycerophosphate glycerophosphotransferase [Micromonospora sp. NBC_01796]|uniref:bifunctional glycosyltransferase/CDP-glycerol:glycerophosphate glycerophosphotransferase n=1 Tax=Micromonospora sp. NBC_01796 TaxID=2975987 RepID=UPI002DDABCF4|nr:bifunctional glycosyltransferase family 2 protein/CDP-glycerol:glycerophosphate glycerophosphotransferase [Micromonospora sp. NBC_01796]WSA87978.1 bifunctional glycosyltransferase family 2 protein/CDP-glycerol:glycerophosphate glycerophosphotransferase [Micromonospora sp. NBC_01796]
MTLISFVVPAYKVEGYLRECLDSILGQPFTDIEVIGVDDRSPDSSGEIFAEYAARDPRLTVVSLPENVGLGEARNIGLDRATGEYVWFVDSDDWLAPDCLPTVARRLRETSPELLIVDHVRSYWDNAVLGSAMRELFPTSPGPTTFSLRQRPELIGLLHTAWNKLVRRDFLVDLGLRFGPGWYEDVSFTYPLVLAAERISVLDLVCVNYRQRRSGAITRTQGDRHFEVFPHWQRVFELVDEWSPRVDDLRPVLFRRMIWHYLTILGNGDRIGPKLRPAFFARMHDDYKRWLPPGGYPVPGGAEGLKHRLVAEGKWRTFSALRTAHLVRGRLRDGVGAARRAVVPPARRSARLGRDAVLRGYYQAQLRLPIDRSLALYAAYWYRGYACNPAAIHAKAGELAPHIRGVFVVRRDRVSSLPPGVQYVVAGTPAYYRALARAKWLINNVNFPDFVVKRPGSVHIQTHHGTPVKVMGLDQQRYPTGAVGMEFPKLLRRIDRWDFSISSNTFSTQMWDRAYPANYVALNTGYPRNDRLANATADEVAAIRSDLGFAPDDLVVLYAPTHREHLPGYRPPFDPTEFVEALGPHGRLLMRSHYFHDRDVAAEVSASGRVRDVSAHPSVEDLYLAADVLVTDYSSAMFDYGTLDRPIVIYAPDWDAYRLARGVYFDVTAEPPGAVATSFPDLLDLFRAGAVDNDASAKARAHFRARFCVLDDGRAAERVVRRTLLGEPG